jgi:DNA-binding response OmpR family regulator
MALSFTRTKQPGRICIVDDTMIHVALLRAILEPRGHMIIPLTSGEEALPEILAHPPDVLMVDIRMPGMDGFDLVEELKARGLSSETRIMFMTSGLDPEHEQRARDLGASDFLRKPFDSEDTIRRVETLMERPTGEAKGDGTVTPMHQQLLSLLESAWRLSLPDEVLSGRPATEFTADDILAMATARVSARARDRGVDLHVEPIPWAVMRGDRELVALAWAQVLEAAVVRAEPGSAVTVALGAGKYGLTLRVGVTCTAATAARMAQFASSASTAAPLRVERRSQGGVEIVVEVGKIG